VQISAVIFDLDGVLIDSEGIWNTARREVALQNGGCWPEDAQSAMMGMSATEWSTYMHDELGVSITPEQISESVVSRLRALYREHVPLIPGACEAVRAVAEEWPLGLASSANRAIIDFVLDLARLGDCFAATVSSEEVAHGKPAPDVYLEAARRLGVPATQCVAIEDSSNGLRSAAAAEMVVLALPNQDFPPAEDAVALAAEVLPSIEMLTPEVIRRAGATPAGDRR
jgi:HAD superfamily hydrolase (TIGR01509 family)